MSLLVLRHVLFHRWEDWPYEGSTFPRSPKLSSLLAQTPFIAQLACCVLSPLRIPTNGLKRECHEEKKISQSCGHHTLGDARRAMLTSEGLSHVFNLVRSCQQNWAWHDGQCSKSRWTGCGVAGFLAWWMDTNSVRRPFHWVWGLENILNYFNYTLQDFYGMNLTHLKFTWSCYLLHQWPRPGHHIIKILSFTHVHKH